MAYCTNCGKETSAKKVCEHCGVKKNKKHNFCEWCGTTIEPTAKVCSNCGEPKKVSSFIGKIVRIPLAMFLMLCGLTYFDDSILLASFIMLVGILLLPFGQRLFRKATHNNIKLRKMISRIAPPVLAVLVFLSMHTCTKIGNYKTAIEHWNNKAYAAAMNYFTHNPKYKDSEEYIEKFENDVLTSLMQTPWCSDLMKYGNYADRWDYEFHADGTLLRRKQLWKENVYVTGSGYELDSYEDTVFSDYSLTYGSNDETGVYEVCIQFGYDFEYVLKLGIAEDGTIVVIGFYGTVGTQGDSWYSRDSHLPE